MSACFVHPAVPATGACDDCKRPICTRCTKGTLDGFMCPPCAHKRYARRRVITGVKVAGILALMVALAVAGLLIVGKGSERPKPPPVTPQDRDPLVAALRASREQAPCDRSLIRQLVGELADQRRDVELVDDANGFFAKCGPYPALEQRVIGALHRLGRFAEAIKHETVLIDDDPLDSDYWWWRGEDRARTDQAAAALADYRQSFANSPRASSARFAAARILDVAAPAGHPCEAVFALGFYQDQLGAAPDYDRDQQVRDLDTSSGCGASRGTGSTTIALAAAGADPDALQVTATVNGVTGRFVLNSSCGTTALASGFAQRAQVAPRPGATVSTVALGAVRTGGSAVAAIAIGGASAPAVEVVVVDGLPPEVDGVIGLSYLWAFDQVFGDGTLALGPGRAP